MIGLKRCKKKLDFQKMAQHFPSVSLFFQTQSFPSNESHYQMLTVRKLPAILWNLCKGQNNDRMCIRLGLFDFGLKSKEPLWVPLILAPPILQHPLPIWPLLFCATWGVILLWDFPVGIHWSCTLLPMKHHSLTIVSTPDQILCFLRTERSGHFDLLPFSPFPPHPCPCWWHYSVKSII